MQKYETKPPRLSSEVHHLLMRLAQIIGFIAVGFPAMFGLVYAVHFFHYRWQHAGIVVSLVSLAAAFGAYYGVGALVRGRIAAKCHHCGGPAYFQEEMPPWYLCRSCGKRSWVEKPRPRKAPKRKFPEPGVVFHDTSLTITDYYFKHATVVADPEIRAGDISCVFRSSDVAFVLKGGEIIFLPEKYKDAFAAFAARHNLLYPDKKVAIWSRLLEPFLDTEYTEGAKEADYRSLEAAGVPRDEADRIRRKVEPTMLRHTFYTMEWGTYSTFDVLWAMKVLWPRRFTPEFYWWVMEIALRNYR